MAGSVFVNYRRASNLKDAQLLQKALQRHLGQRALFLDVSGLDGGDHWLHALEKQVDASAVMIALIGKDWVDVRDEQGNRRLENQNDFVRFEIVRAFSRAIPVLPVLIDGAAMPEPMQLPTNLLPLTFCQAMRLRSESLDDDAAHIARRIRYLIAQSRPRRLPYRIAVPLAAVMLTVGLASGAVLWQLYARPIAGGFVTELIRAKIQNDELQDQLTKVTADFKAVTMALDQAESASRRALEARATIEMKLQNIVSQRDAAVEERNAAQTALTRAKLVPQPGDTRFAVDLGIDDNASQKPNGYFARTIVDTRFANSNVLDGLQQLVQVRISASSGQVELHHIAGPFSDANAALRFCADLIAKDKGPCQVTTYDGYFPGN